MDRPSWRLDHVRLRVGDVAAAAAELRAAGFTPAPLGEAAEALVLVREHLELERGPDRWPRLAALALEPRHRPPTNAAPTTLRRAGDGAVSFAESGLDPSATMLPLYRSRQLTPARLRTPHRLRHPNGATALAGLTVVVPAPRAAARELAAVVGAAALTATDEVVAAHLGNITLLLATPGDAELLHPDLAVDLEDEPPAAALVVALAVAVGDLVRACAVLAAAGVAHRRRADGSVGLRLAAAGLALELRGPACP